MQACAFSYWREEGSIEILVIDLSGTADRFLFARLSQVGHVVQFADNSATAVTLQRTFEPGLIVFLPGQQDALAAIASKLKLAPKCVPILAVGRCNTCEHIDARVLDVDRLELVLQAMGAGSYSHAR